MARVQIDNALFHAGSAAAQDAAASPSPVRDYLGMPSPSAPGVEVQAWFPSHPRLQFPLGETVRNLGSADIHVTTCQHGP